MLALATLVACESIAPPTVPEADRVEWEPHERPLGRGRVLERNSIRQADGFRLHLQPESADGGQFRTRQRFGFGGFEARIRCPRAPGSLCAFFLYEDRGGHLSDEIDVEIFNDGSRRALLVTWVDGVQTNKREVRLPFDPAEAHHTYRISHRESRVAFLIDGTEYARFDARLPRREMHVYLNAWYPTWLAPRPATVPLMDVTGVRIAP